MSSLPPPPPPPLPPPPPPPSGGPPAKAAMPPLPPPAVTFTEKEEGTVQDALLSSCKILEEARCLKSEKEANLMMASTLLSNHEKADVDISNFPGGIQDAWLVLSETTKPKHNNNNTSENATISLQDKDSTKPVATLPVGQGQLGKVACMAALSNCVQKTTQVSNKITLERQKADGSILKSALETNKRKLNSNGGRSSSTTTQAVAATTKLWMRIMDHRLKEIRSYHARNSNHEMVSKTGLSFDVNNRNRNPNKRARLGNPGADGYDLASSVLESLRGIRDGSSFSSEEVMGKYLDLQPLYESHVIPIKSIMMKPSHSTTTPNANANNFGFTDFLAFLSKGDSGLVEGISESTKLKERKKYVRFLLALENYLEGFLGRIQPLLSKDRVTEAAFKDFQETWSKTGGSPGWEAKPSEAFLVNGSSSTENGAANNDATANAPLKIDLSPYASAADLEKALDGDKLKAELTRLGLKCGGTVSDRAKRLFMTKDTPLSELPKKLFAKKKAAPGQANSDKGAAPVRVNVKNERRVDIAKREVVVMAYLNQLKPILEATIRRTGRRETQTTKEREKEMDEDLHGSLIEDAKKKSSEGGKYSSDEDSDDEDAPIYNPKGVPLGWDGKPIPYWLFKLHGLNHFYKCEICGGESYRGRKNFETHFAEARHSYGMKSLGIPNTKHFHGVTKIEDAQILWEKLKNQLQQDQFDGNNGEEYEDSHGNVLSRSTYEDLARQGLL
eukprot:CAMPEP_0116132464 /NCGR_PEP_ID=MMETSP0329-20121206/9561_1 /TAXON_ID=697910 /ORGANISM="Pseudo-nitzschia arenysensis, Strain B593" /LENGTH=729 /DNA_ID=CAMNT_0003626979 /DNA_START=75 /DNA_END=2264 /DNA_ORIENTATION=-